MSILRRDAPPPSETWDALREWSRQSWWARYRASLLVMLPFTTIVLALAGAAMLVAEFSMRSATLIFVLWLVGVPVTALGYMRRMSRAAAQVPPISPASLNPTTAVDIRGNRESPKD
jgi:hypothetical protein